MKRHQQNFERISKAFDMYIDLEKTKEGCTTLVKSESALSEFWSYSCDGPYEQDFGVVLECILRSSCETLGQRPKAKIMFSLKEISFAPYVNLKHLNIRTGKSTKYILKIIECTNKCM